MLQIKNSRNNPALVVSSFVKALKLLTTPGIRQFLIIPILINILLYGTAFSLSYFYMNELIEQFIPAWLHWLNWVLWPLFFICFSIVVFFSFTVLANLLAAPFYGKLAAKTQWLITGQVGSEVIQPLRKVMLAEIKRANYLAVRFIPSLILFIIPGVNIVAPFLWALLGAWGMALEYLAYPLENEGILFSEQKQLLKARRLSALSFGGITMFGLTVPVLNIVMAPLAVIAATIYCQALKAE
ncbi:MAG: sulfate transporter CysZ [Methylococcaceae bacterium]|jgi:CysZ protein